MKRMFADTPEGQFTTGLRAMGRLFFLCIRQVYHLKNLVSYCRQLAKKYRAIAVDVLGCGNSDQTQL